MVKRSSNEFFSVILSRFITDTFATLLMASCGMLRGMLPNGVPKVASAIEVLEMNRTWSLVTATKGQGMVGSLSQPDLPIAVKLTNWFGSPVQTGSVPVKEKMKQASPANIPTEVWGAFTLPRNGRAESNPMKLPRKPWPLPRMKPRGVVG